MDASTQSKVEEALRAANIAHDGILLDNVGVKVRLKDTDTQLKAKDALESTFNPSRDDPRYVIALNLLSASPQWLTAMHALPMYLGLDLRGGVHFLLQVDMKGALTKRLDSTSADLRTLLRDKKLRHAGIGREGERIVIKFRDAETRNQARNAIGDSVTELALAEMDMQTFNDPLMRQRRASSWPNCAPRNALWPCNRPQSMHSSACRQFPTPSVRG